VVIKSRFVVLMKAGAQSVSTHLRYIERDGTTREGQKGQAYGPDTDTADLQAFGERGQGDRHQFRFIVSVEDAGELEDLRDYTRTLMAHMAVDLETSLDWVAVDHWDTDNPHTHVVLRGRSGEGRGADLVIAPDYMAHGMRQRACELATEWLGPRAELEMRQSLQCEVEQQRWTGLDRQLQRRAVADVVDLTENPGRIPGALGAQRVNLLRARLQRLEAMALAEHLDSHRWRLAPRMEQTLTAMAECGDILRTMHRAMKGEERELVTDVQVDVSVVGRIAAKGLGGELHDRPYLVVDGIDGRAHYLRLQANTDLAELQVGGFVESKPQALERAVDRTVLDLAQKGIYTTAHHRAQLLQVGDRDPQATVDVHVRRLEALRRRGIVERVADGVWAVPPDLLQRVRQHGAQKEAGHAVEMRSHLPLEQQIHAVGSTWLDRALVVSGSPQPAAQGFGAEVREAMSQRVDFLVGEGLAERREQRVVFARNLLATLQDRELIVVGQKLQQETGRTWRPVRDGETIGGVYRQSVQLASGRFAMLDDGMGFRLVPWRPVIEHRAGLELTATLSGGGVSWSVGLQRAQQGR
jgi:type IV secretory pathway VirD2 relaxase